MKYLAIIPLLFLISCSKDVTYHEISYKAQSTVPMFQLTFGGSDGSRTSITVNDTHVVVHPFTVMNDASLYINVKALADSSAVAAQIFVDGVAVTPENSVINYTTILQETVYPDTTILQPVEIVTELTLVASTPI